MGQVTTLTKEQEESLRTVARNVCYSAADYLAKDPVDQDPDVNPHQAMPEIRIFFDPTNLSVLRVEVLYAKESEGQDG